MKKNYFFLLIFTGVLFFLTATSYAGWENLWLYPEAGFSYNPHSTDGFEVIRFEGWMTETVIQQGFFYDPQEHAEVFPLKAEIHFRRGEEHKIFEVQNLQEVLTIDEFGTHYQLEIAIPENVSEGEWIPEIYFLLPNERETEVFLVDDDGNPDTILIDTTPPEVSFSYTPDTFTNEPIQVSVHCEDVSGCTPPDINDQSFFVRGNFNEENDLLRGFEICDQVGNCTDPEHTQISIDFYDPVPPLFEGISISGNGRQIDGELGFAENTLKSGESIIFSIQKATDQANDLRMIDYADRFENNACGNVNDEGNPFYLEEGRCVTKFISCAQSAVWRSWANRSFGQECENKTPNICDHFPLCFPFVLSSPESNLFPAQFPIYLGE